MHLCVLSLGLLLDAVHLPVVVTRHILLLGELALLREGSEDTAEDRRPLLKVLLPLPCLIVPPARGG